MMKSAKWAGLGLISGLIGSVAVTLASGVSAETLRVGTECTYAPFNYRTADGELAGYDVDVARGVGKLIGADIEFVCQQWDGMIPALLANKFDLIVASLSITEERKKRMDFSNAYRDSGGRIIGPADLAGQLFDADGMPIAENFKGLRLGVERATTFESWLRAELPELELVLYDGAEPLYVDLQNGRIDLIMMNPMAAHTKFLSKDAGKGYAYLGPTQIDPAHFGVGIGIGLRQDQEALKARLNGALADLIESGELAGYGSKYFPFAIYTPREGS